MLMYSNRFCFRYLNMDRWNGILRVPLSTNSNSLYKVAASLCVSRFTGRLAVPSANAIFFSGDRVEGTGNPVIERLSDLQRIADILVSNFGNSVNAWVVEAATFNGPFAVFKDFIPTVNEYGEPKLYDASECPASLSTVLLLKSCLKEAKSAIAGEVAKSAIAGEVKEPFQSNLSSSPPFRMRTILLGFSKGGTILNQLIAELSYSEVLSKQDLIEASTEIGNGNITAWEDQIIPTSKDSFLNSISEIHYVDVGLNSTGAYLNDRDAIQRIYERLKQGASGIRFLFHGTPRQWHDGRRIWIHKEKDELIRLLKEAARDNFGRLAVHERLYFAGIPPNLQMHFEIIEHLDVS
ncbi:hypothetical protein Leryth_015474 [Lithospermum erythrorhizon]|nr:hypothetical protein Leryth_015474 [Lithospermum erythrorhizon]